MNRTKNIRTSALYIGDAEREDAASALMTECGRRRLAICRALALDLADEVDSKARIPEPSVTCKMRICDSSDAFTLLNPLLDSHGCAFEMAYAVPDSIAS